MKFWMIYLLVIFVLVSGISCQFKDTLKDQDAKKSEQDVKREEYLASRKAAKSTTETMDENEHSTNLK